MSTNFEFDNEEVTVIAGPTFQFIPTINKNAFLKVEVIRSRSLIDDQRNREMVWHRFSYADAVSGYFEPLYSIPYGLSVSGQ